MHRHIDQSEYMKYKNICRMCSYTSSTRIYMQDDDNNGVVQSCKELQSLVLDWRVDCVGMLI